MSADAVQARLTARVESLAARGVLTPWQAAQMVLGIAIARARCIAAQGGVEPRNGERA